MHSSKEELEWGLQLLMPKWIISTTPSCRAMELDYVKKYCSNTKISCDSLSNLLDITFSTHPSKPNTPVKRLSHSPLAETLHTCRDVESSQTPSTTVVVRTRSRKHLLNLSPNSKQRSVTLFGRARLGFQLSLSEYDKETESKPGKVRDQILQYGTPKDLDDFCLQAQLVNYIQYRALLEGWTSRMWSKYTGVLIWKTQNPWTGLRGQFYDHLHDQTAGFYGCRSAAEPIHVQLDLMTYNIEVVNTSSDDKADVAIEASVWDLDGTCPYYKVSEKLIVPSKKTLPIFELEYPKSKNAKPVYFLLLKLYNISDYGILSRNFYWLHLPGGDYKSLEPYRKKKVPIKVTSEALIRGSKYEVRMHVENTSKKPNSVSCLDKNVLLCLDSQNHKRPTTTTRSLFQRIQAS